MVKQWELLGVTFKEDDENMSKKLYMKINIGGDVEVPCEKVVFE